MLRGSCFPSSHSSMLLPHLQLWGSLQQHRVKWPQQYPNKAELKRDVSSQSPERKSGEQGGSFSSASAVCVWALELTGGREGVQPGEGENLQLLRPDSPQPGKSQSCPGRSHAPVTDEKGLIKNCAWMEKCDLLFQKHYPLVFAYQLAWEKQISLDWRPKESLCAGSSPLQPRAEILTQCKNHKHCLTSDAWVTSAQCSFGGECEQG